MNFPYLLSIDPISTTSLPKPEKVPSHQRSDPKDKALQQGVSYFNSRVIMSFVEEVSEAVTKLVCKHFFALY